MPGPEILALFIPIIALMIPVVAVLTKHQQRMAEIINGNQANRVDLNSDRLLQEIQSLRLEVNGLKQLVHEQAIAFDTSRNLSPPPDLRTRLDTTAQ